MMLWFLGALEGRALQMGQPSTATLRGAQALPWQFIQGKGKGGEELLQEIVQLWQVVALQSLQSLLGGVSGGSMAVSRAAALASTAL